jgi:serine protease inhibitor
MEPQHSKKSGIWYTLRERFRPTRQETAPDLTRTTVEELLAQLTASKHPENTNSQRVVTRTTLTAAQNAFGFRLFRELAKPPQHNVFVSPTSIALALSMTYNGASGETQEAMASVLELRDMSVEEIKRESAMLLSILNDVEPEIELSVANSLWMRYPERVLPPFQQRSRQYFQAELHDYAGVPDSINAWVSQQTRGRISHIVGREILDEEARAVLVNAIYFRGRWTDVFESRDTHEAPFTRLNGGRETCWMMSQHGGYAYHECSQFQAIRLPYGDQNLSMLVFLPHKRVRYAEFLAEFTLENWKAWRERLRYQKGTICLPRFRCEYTQDLSSVLTQMGMGIAFDRNRADFSQLCPEFFIGQVRHKTFVDVKEEGTEAAAVTAIGMSGSANVKPEPHFVMVVDRPFVCAIVDERTEAILFLGAIVEPK